MLKMRRPLPLFCSRQRQCLLRTREASILIYTLFITEACEDLTDFQQFITNGQQEPAT